MKILESPLMGEFIAYLKSNWGGNSRVNQRLRRLRQLVAMMRGVADAAEGRQAAQVRGSTLYLWLEQLRMEALRGQAVLDATSNPPAVVGSAKKLLTGIRALFVCGAEVDRLTDAVEGLESLTSPGADLDLFLKVLELDAAMDVDAAAAAPYVVEQGSYCVFDSAVPGAKRKRAGGSSGVDPAEAGEATSHGRLVDRAPYRHKRRALMGKRQRSSATQPAGSSDSSLAVAMEMARVRRGIGKPDLDRRLSQISLQGRRRMLHVCCFPCRLE